MKSNGWKPRTGQVKSCPVCHIEFYLKPSYSMRKFCSPKCASESFKKDKLQFNCQVCTKIIYRPEKYVKLRGEPKYCSKTCMYKVSKKHPEVGEIKVKSNTKKKNIKIRLDTIFSKFIRLRDTDENMYGKCCTCSKYIKYDEGDAGHFINRRFMSTRWREDNVFLQCRKCNRFEEGNGAAYSMFIIKKFGIKRLEYLDALKNEHTKFTESDMLLLIEDYKKRVKELLKTKNL